MSVSIPQPFISSVSVSQPFRTKLEGLPSDYAFSVEKMAPIVTSIEAIPTIHLAVDALPKVQYGVDPLELRITRWPSTRTHLPMDYQVGLSVLGMELLSVRLCGEGMVITEPYEPHRCEACGERASDERYLESPQGTEPPGGKG